MESGESQQPAMETNRQIQISGMECASCERLITKAVESAGGKVHAIDAKAGTAVIDYPQAHFEKIKQAISAAGYGISGAASYPQAEPFEKEARIFMDKLFSGEKDLWVERKILKMSILSFLMLVAIGFFLYLFIWHGLSTAGSRIPFMLYNGISAVALTASIAHFRAHRNDFTCMEGMMIGMTIGMMAGFLFGAVVGATNGMFVGSVYGIAIGMLTGAYCGRCCGIMGVLEGMMAGLMGGLMGAMTSLMLISDNLLLFIPILLLSCLAILAGLTYMVYNSAGKRVERSLAPFGQFFAIAFALSVLSVAIMLFGPKGPITV